MAIITKLSDKEIRKWEFLSSISDRQKKDKIKPYSITISRDSGSGGKLVAKKVAQNLNFKFYNKKLIRLIAQTAHKRKELIESLDEGSQDLIVNLVKTLIGEDYLSGRSYIRFLCQTVLSLAKKGNAVILGRGANFIIPREMALRVKITAPLKTRIVNTAKFERMSFDKARDFVTRVDKERKEFIRKYFFKDIKNANYYDLVINTKYITINQAADIVIKAFKQKFG